MREKDVEEILNSSNVYKIKKLLKMKKHHKEIYEFVTKRFHFIPIDFCNPQMEKSEVDKDPLKAIQSINNHVDGSMGDKTTVTPKELLEIYSSAWTGVIESNVEEIKRGRKAAIPGPHFNYNLKWKKCSGICGDVSGDVLISYPKFAVPQSIPLFLIKLFSRLVYTVGNFMPVPKIGRGKNSLNSIHSYQKKGIRYERLDCFLLDLKDPNIKYNDYYCKLLGKKFSWDTFCEYNFLSPFRFNKEVYDLSTLELSCCKNKTMLEELTMDNLEEFFWNACACIIARGNLILNKIDK